MFVSECVNSVYIIKTKTCIVRIILMILTYNSSSNYPPKQNGVMPHA